MANPTEVAGWRVDETGRHASGCKTWTAGKFADLERGANYDYLVLDWDHDPGIRPNVPVPVLLAMLRALGYEITPPGATDWRALLCKVLAAIGSHEGSIFEWAWVDRHYDITEDERATVLAALQEHYARSG